MVEVETEQAGGSREFGIRSLTEGTSWGKGRGGTPAFVVGGFALGSEKVPEMLNPLLVPLPLNRSQQF